MSQLSRDDFREIASTVTPRRVSHYLATTWDLESRVEGIKEIWQLRDEDGKLQGRIMLPLATDYVDFFDRFTEALNMVGNVSGMDASRLMEQIQETRTDLLLIRLDQVASETISFHQAKTTIDAIYDIVRDAAYFTIDPERFREHRRGAPPASVADFLREDIRLGHTKRGSFIFTLVARLGETNTGDSRLEADMPLAREVLTSLARNVERISTRGDNPQRDVELNELDLRTRLVKPLRKITDSAGVRSVDLSFEWASGESRPDVGLRPIVLTRDILSEGPRNPMMAIEESSAVRIGEHRAITGYVQSLRHNGTDGDGVAEISAEVDGLPTTVTAYLSAEAHEVAIRAYSNRTPLTVEGDLVYERKSWVFHAVSRVTGQGSTLWSQ
ncbi:hypothetical protein ABH926_007077 [Catenulispora sp. GP43]|uniref:hypothetical protein n=1 Tax=Catenulispora sp. GP43 TaxID=3156263 RepID=UPI00351325EA